MRKKLLLLILALITVQLITAQQNIRHARQESWQSFVYKIPADTAEAYIQKQDIPRNQ